MQEDGASPRRAGTVTPRRPFSDDLYTPLSGSEQGHAQTSVASGYEKGASPFQRHDAPPHTNLPDVINDARRLPDKSPFSASSRSCDHTMRDRGGGVHPPTQTRIRPMTPSSALYHSAHTSRRRVDLRRRHGSAKNHRDPEPPHVTHHHTDVLSSPNNRCRLHFDHMRAYDARSPKASDVDDNANGVREHASNQMHNVPLGLTASFDDCMKEYPLLQRLPPFSIMRFVCRVVDTIVITSYTLTRFFFLWAIPVFFMWLCAVVASVFLCTIVYLLLHRFIVPSRSLTFPVFFHHNPPPLLLREPHIAFHSPSLHDKGDDRPILAQGIDWWRSRSVQTTNEESLEETPLPSSPSQSKCESPSSDSHLFPGGGREGLNARSQSAPSLKASTLMEPTMWASGDDAQQQPRRRHQQSDAPYTTQRRSHPEDERNDASNLHQGEPFAPDASLDCRCSRQRRASDRRQRGPARDDSDAGDNDMASQGKTTSRSGVGAQSTPQSSGIPQPEVAVAFVTFDNRTWEFGPRGVSEQERCLLYHQLRAEGRDNEAEAALHLADDAGSRTSRRRRRHGRPPREQAVSSLLNIRSIYDAVLVVEYTPYRWIAQQQSSSSDSPGSFDHRSWDRDHARDPDDIIRRALPSSLVTMVSLELFDTNCTRKVRSARPHVLTPDPPKGKLLAFFESVFGGIRTTPPTVLTRHIPLIERLRVATRHDIHLARLELRPPIPVISARLLLIAQLSGIPRVMQDFPWLCGGFFVTVTATTLSTLLTLFCVSVYARGIRSMHDAHHERTPPQHPAQDPWGGSLSKTDSYDSLLPHDSRSFDGGSPECLHDAT